MSGPMGYSSPLPPWWAFVIGILLLMFVGLPLFMVTIILMAKWMVFILEVIF